MKTVIHFPLVHKSAFIPDLPVAVRRSDPDARVSNSFIFSLSAEFQSDTIFSLKLRNVQMHQSLYLFAGEESV